MKVAIGTPMYGGTCTAGYMTTVFNLMNYLKNNCHEVIFITVINESLISRARNEIARRFLETDADVLLFIDADITFDAKNVYDMLMLDLEVVGSVVPIKKMNWESIVEGMITYNGMVHPNMFGRYFNINSNSHSDLYDLAQQNKPFEVLRIGTAVLSIKRNVFEQMKPIVKTYVSNTQGEDRMVSWDFFPVYVEDEILISEDFSFCNRWREMGNKVYAVGHFDVTHNGTFDYIGNFKRELKKDREYKEKMSNAKHN